MSTSRSYGSGYFSLVIGDDELGIVGSVKGGSVSADMVNQKVAGMSEQVKALGNVKVEPITFTVGASLGKPFFEWIEKSWTRSVERRDGSIVVYDYDGKPQYEIEFKRALIIETAVPALDAAGGKASAMLTVKIHPEEINIAKAKPGRILGRVPQSQKAFTTSNFRFGLDTVETGRVTKIESFVVKQNVKTLDIGARRIFDLEPASLEYPNLTFTTSLDTAGELIAWHKKMVIDGETTFESETTGHITFLDPTLSEELLVIEMDGVGIAKVAIEDSDVASRSGIKRVRVECYVTEFKFKPK